MHIDPSRRIVLWITTRTSAKVKGKKGGWHISAHLIEMHENKMHKRVHLHRGPSWRRTKKMHKRVHCTWAHLNDY